MCIFDSSNAKPETPLMERGGSVVECRTPEREVRGSKPTATVLCPWARHFTPRKYWLITQEAMAPSRHDWKIVDWDVKPQHNQPLMDILYWLRFRMRMIGRCVYSDKYSFSYLPQYQSPYVQVNFTCWTSVWGIYWLIDSSTLTTALCNQ